MKRRRYCSDKCTKAYEQKKKAGQHLMPMVAEGKKWTVQHYCDSKKLCRNCRVPLPFCDLPVIAELQER